MSSSMSRKQRQVAGPSTLFWATGTPSDSHMVKAVDSACPFDAGTWLYHEEVVQIMDHILYPFASHDPGKGIGDHIKYLRGRSEAERKTSVHIVSPVPTHPQEGPVFQVDWHHLVGFLDVQLG